MGRKSREKQRRREGGGDELLTVSNVEDPRFIAAVKLLERTGMRQFQIRYSDDEAPVVWMAVAQWFVDERGHPLARDGHSAYKVGSAFDPLGAVLSLCEKSLDGGTCKHCGRPSGVTVDWSSAMPFADAVCWYVYDPETQTFRRSCEGDAP